MSMEYIRRVYGVPAKRGMRVVFDGNGQNMAGTITGSSGQYLLIRITGQQQSKLFHPTWSIRYITPDGA